MNKKWLPYLLLALIAIAIIVIKRPGSRAPGKTDQTAGKSRGFQRDISRIEYTRHAKCRMDCRYISQSEVELIMKEGKINYRKSDLNDKPCPIYALEGITPDQQRVRIVYAQCARSTRVVTVIDLDREWDCDCTGDATELPENKNEIP